MGQERMPVNIFPGVLPGAYLFLDDGSDTSKWTNWGAYPWDSINTGDAYGYFGKGLEFKSSDPVGANTHYIAARHVIMPQYIARQASFYFGFIIQPLLPNYTIGPNKLIPYIMLQYAKGVLDVMTTKNFGFKFNFRTSTLNRILTDVFLVSNVEFGNPVSETIKQLTTMDNGIQSINGLLPWIKVQVYVENDYAIAAKVNDDIIVIDPPFALGGQILFHDTKAQFYGNGLFACLNKATNAKENNYGFCIDQIWISDTENLV